MKHRVTYVIEVNGDWGETPEEVIEVLNVLLTQPGMVGYQLSPVETYE